MGPLETAYDFKTERKVPKTGMMLVGWGGNNGTTVTAGIIANKRGLVWDTKEGRQEANYYGSVVMGSTVKLGTDANTHKDVNIPFSQVLPMVHPNDLVIGGWDISKMNMAEAMDRANVLEPTLKAQVKKEMSAMVPLPSVYYPDFIAANGLDKVIVMWTANTERYASVIEGINDTADNMLKSIEQGHEEVSPSSVFAVACILENAPFINGSPQNTFVPGVLELAEKHNAFIGGDDFKSGQTKMKSALVDFLISAGIKLTSIASYNHLGNNDGKNLSSQKQFRSKEISKSNVVDDMVEANSVLYKPGEHPDHLVVIAEMFTRIQWKAASTDGATTKEFKNFHSVLSVLSFMLKAPLTPPGTPVINALAKQRSALVNIFRACVGLEPENDMTLEHKLF